jgi:hypothetical protein
MTDSLVASFNRCLHFTESKMTELVSLAQKLMSGANPSLVTTHRRYSKGLFQYGQIFSQACESDNCPRSGCYPFLYATPKLVVVEHCIAVIYKNKHYVEHRIADIYENEQ